jgi:hypothetical protein
MPPPHEYYICNVSQRPTQQKSTSKGGGLSEVPSLIHNGVLMYMRTVTEPRGTLPSVCAPAGLRRPCAHTSDSRIPIRHHLSNPQKSSLPLQTTPRRCIGTIDIVEPVFGGLGPATYRSAEAPVDWFQKRGMGYVRRVRITDPTPQAGVVHARDTWQHTTPLHGNSPSPLATKNQASGRACSIEPPARDHADAPRSTEAGSRFWPPTHPRIAEVNQRDISEISSGYQRDISEISPRLQRDTDEPGKRARPTPYASSSSPSSPASEGFSSWE